jgi:hypothetical protein
MTWFPRLLGVATAAYGAAVIVKPDLMLRPAGLSTTHSTAADTLTRSVGARDIASGLAMAAAPSGHALRTALAVRVLSDLGDAVFFGLALRGKPQRTKAVGIAAGWGALCALSALTTRS